MKVTETDLLRLEVVHGIIVFNTILWIFLGVMAHPMLLIPAIICVIAGIIIEPVMRKLSAVLRG